MVVHSFILGTVALVSHLSSAIAQDVKPFAEFKTEPSFRAPILNITYATENTHLVTPGYYFYGPFALEDAPGAPIISDSHGNLVWYGRDASQHAVKSFRVCDYMGIEASHLCWSDFSFNTLGAERARNRIFDNTYTSVRREFGAIGDLDDPNPHEFNMLQRGRTFTQAIYQIRRMNLEAYMGPKNGFIIDPCFQEVDVENGQPVFRWCGLDHLKLWETIMFPFVPGRKNYSEMIAGDGMSTTPWDFAHINGIDKIMHGPSAGDYLVSTRHHDTIYKVAGRDSLSGSKPGSILWRLGGEGAIQKDFTMLGNWTFSRQHHVSFLGYGGQHGKSLRISLFDNGWEVRNKEGFTGRNSSGQIILLDEETMEAELEHEYVHPYGGLAIAQGGMHVTPQGNAIVGWGTIPEISEYAQDGTLLFHARFSNKSGENYRAYKFPWQGKPSSPPKLLAYSRRCTAGAKQKNSKTPLMAYVSWNGATEVTHWRFYVSTRSPSGPWIRAGTFPKTGFETAANLTGLLYTSFVKFAPYVSVEALDRDGHVLGRTQSSTFVPGKRISAYEEVCDELGCNIPFFSYKPEQSCAEECGVGSILPALAALMVLVVGLESLAYLAIKGFDTVMGDSISNINVCFTGEKIL